MKHYVIILRTIRTYKLLIFSSFSSTYQSFCFCKSSTFSLERQRCKYFRTNHKRKCKVGKRGLLCAKTPFFSHRVPFRRKYSFSHKGGLIANETETQFANLQNFRRFRKSPEIFHFPYDDNNS